MSTSSGEKPASKHVLTAERCPKNPSMPKAFCSHCQGTERGTANNPKFSIRPGYHDCWPVVEILKDGGPIHIYDQHFRFGIRKAQLLLSCITVLGEFWKSTEKERKDFRPRLIEDERGRLTVFAFAEMHPDFERSDRQTIDHPWLRLRVLPSDREKIGLGVMKCRAVCAVAGDLRRWLISEGAPPPGNIRQTILGD